jgi:hypothetical protein
MAEVILCKICGQRRAKRACPAVEGDICPLCCGTQREVSLSCPLSCTFLREAHKHEKTIPVAETDVSDREVEFSEDFFQQHEELMLFCMFSLLQAALRTPGAVDADLLEALAAVIKTHRTAESGLLYESRPENTIAAGVQRIFSEGIAEYEKMRQEKGTLALVSETKLLPALVLLRRIAQQSNNGRPRGRMFIDLLSQMAPSAGVDERAPSIIL